MGNTDPHSSYVNMLTHFEKRFIISPHPLDPDENHMFYMHQRLSNNKYILRVLSTNDTDEKQKAEQLICKKLAMANKNNDLAKTPIVPIDHYLFEEDKGYCNSINKCYMLFNPMNSQPLAYHLARGHYNNNLQKNINEETVYRGLLNLIEGVALLKFYNHPHRHINCETVYFAKDENTFILGDPWISPLTDFHQQYHAPEKLKQMRNQVDKHDPFLADLFSIGMVGLKMLGNNNLIEYYSLHKTIDQPGLMQLAKNIKHNHLQALILNLLTEDIQVRNVVLNQTKVNRQQLHDSKTTKTRNLSGKVASVRKSFTNGARPIAKFGGVADQLHSPQSTNPYQFSRVVEATAMPVNHSQLFAKKLSHYEPPQIRPTSSSQLRAQLANQKPEIDMIMPLTPANLILTPFSPHPHGLQNKTSQQAGRPNNLGFPPKQISPNPNNMVSFSINPPGRVAPVTPNFTYVVNKIGSNSSLDNSKSERLLKNVSSTPVSFINSQFSHQKGKALPVTFSQRGLELKNSSNKNINSQQEYLTGKNINSTVDECIGKRQGVIFVDIKRNQPLTMNVGANFVNERTQKQDSQPLRTNSSYPSSQSFESDHFYQKKIYENIKNLESKVSEAINASRLNCPDSRILSDPCANSENPTKMVESLIVVKDQQSIGNNLVKAGQQQLTREDPTIQFGKDKISSNESKNQVIQQQRLSPILVREPEQSESVQDYSKSEEEQIENAQQSLDFLIINSSKQSSCDDKQKHDEISNLQSEQKFQDMTTTPAKAPSLLRLEGNNLTIPEQSDEESVQGEGEVSRYKGQYVEEMYENGGKYLGYMLNGQRNGNGVFYYKDGGYYDGRWKQNMMNGYGKLYYETGKLAYEGQWYQDEFHGRGTVYNDQPEMVPSQGFDYKNMNESENYWHYYQGDLSHDMKARYGKLVLSNGQFYEGEFKNDQVNGKGAFHKLNGTVVKGMWSEGFLIREI